MSNPIPIALSNAIRFPPISFRGHSRSPSRSPVRKSLFLAKEIDPFLSNLSPDSTLRALQATSTIDEGGAGQDILARSIADASPEEREIGIRAAVTAQKLKQWRQELEHWPWPGVRDRRSGAGFLLPRRPSVPSLAVLNSTHMGYLPSASVNEYRDRIEHIRDGVEALELDDIKDHVSSIHTQPPPSDGLEENAGVQTRFGKMRDFTALVTATVVQALPDMMQVNMLLDTWDIRLAILRQVPSIERDLAFLKDSIEDAKASLRTGRTIALPEVYDIEQTKTMLADQVSALGTRIDKLLDLLEGQEDTLPKAWIDTLETIENNFATWLEEAAHVLMQRRLSLKTLTKQPSIQIHGPDREEKKASQGSQVKNQSSADTLQSENEEAGPLAELPPPEAFHFPLSKKAPESSMHSRKPSLSILARAPAHKRDVSEVSVAESALSGISDLSNAEIIDARSTKVLMSPKINVVDNPFRSSREGMSWLMSDAANISNNPAPPALNRASTTSIKVVSKDSVRPVTIVRSQSFDMLSSIKPCEPSTPSRALRQLNGQDSPRASLDSARLAIDYPASSPSGQRKSSMSRHPSLMVEPLSTKTKELYFGAEESPPVPRRSSKRPTRSESAESAPQSSPSEIAEPQTPVLGEDMDTAIAANTSPLRQSPRQSEPTTLEEKIKNILKTIPTRIHLENEPAKKESIFSRSTPSTRSSTPAPVLTLSPAKADRSNRKAAPGDVRLFHLTKSGQSKDSVPVKLFVRSVGEHGERVMVRVGGGWADLAEYLREYSVHHGSRGIASGQLEVASLPTKPTHTGQSPSVIQSTTLPEMAQNIPDPETPSKRRFSLSSLSNLAVGRSRKSSRSKSLTSQEIGNVDTTPPPVPNIPNSYTTQVTTPKSPLQPQPNLKGGLSRSVSAHLGSSNYSWTTPKVPVVTTTAIQSTSPASYTPLGAAGPKSGVSKRAASYNMLRQDNEAWVEGMVDKARAVSGGNSQSYTISATPASVKSRHGGPRLFSADGQDQPAYTPGMASSRPKSRMGFGDVGSIKRVFLRRKSEKV